MTDLTFAAATDIAAAIKAGDISSRDITEHYIQRIERLDASVNAVCVRTFEQALDAADHADASLAKGESFGPLHGVPMSIKESYVLAGTPATWGIPAYRGNVATADGLAVARFKSAGAHFKGTACTLANLIDDLAGEALVVTAGMAEAANEQEG